MSDVDAIPVSPAFHASVRLHHAFEVARQQQNVSVEVGDGLLSPDEPSAEAMERVSLLALRALYDNVDAVRDMLTPRTTRSN